jgi:hypothetical protein
VKHHYGWDLSKSGSPRLETTPSGLLATMHEFHRGDVVEPRALFATLFLARGYSSATRRANTVTNIVMHVIPHVEAGNSNRSLSSFLSYMAIPHQRRTLLTVQNIAACFPVPMVFLIGDTL